MTSISDVTPPRAPSENGTKQPASAPVADDVRSWKLLTTLGGGGALAGLLIVVAFQWTLPRIEAHKASVLRGAIEEVLHAPAKSDTLYLGGTTLSATAPTGADAKTAERLYRGYTADGKPVGYAITASEAGFADQIVLIFGYDPGTKRVLGMKVLGSKETPGLGDKIEKPDFTGQFAGVKTPIRGVKAADGKGSDESAVVMITGATISSRTIIREINKAVARWEPLIAAYETAQRQGGGK